MNDAVFKKAIINMIGIAGVAALSGALQAASFDCAKAAAPIEKLICSDETTSKLDEDLAGAYKAAMEKADNKDALKQQQRTWLKEKRNACKDTACLTEVYQERIVALNQQNQPEKRKKVVSFTLVYGGSNPICQPYVDMLNAAKYTDVPICVRKILPDFPKFKAINWVKIEDRNEMEKIMDENIKIQYAYAKLLNSNGYKMEWRHYQKAIQNNKLDLYVHKIDIDGDGLEDSVYKVVQQYLTRSQYQQCTTYNRFYVRNPKITLENITHNDLDPYRAFNFDGSNDLFIFNDSIYSSHWNGTIIEQGSNLDIYSVGSKKVCGILVK